jgi:hypothetical protein
VFLATLVVGLSQMAFSQEPISKGTWAYKNGKPESGTIDYGTELTAEDIARLSAVDSIARISMGYAAIDSEYVTIEGDLDKLGRLKNLEAVYLNKDGIVDDDLKFIALLPKIRELEFNAKNGEGGCTDRCAEYLSSAKTLRELRIYNGPFTDKFVAKITQGLPDLEELMLSSPELTDESLRLIAERCKKLKSLSIGSKHFTAEGLKQLDRLRDLKERRVSSPALRKKKPAAFGAGLKEAYDGRCEALMPPEAIASLLDEVIKDHPSNVTLTLVRHPKPSTQPADARTAWICLVADKPLWVTIALRMRSISHPRA